MMFFGCQTFVRAKTFFTCTKDLLLLILLLWLLLMMIMHSFRTMFYSAVLLVKKYEAVQHPLRKWQAPYFIKLGVLAKGPPLRLSKHQTNHSSFQGSWIHTNVYNFWTCHVFTLIIIHCLFCCRDQFWIE